MTIILIKQNTNIPKYTADMNNLAKQGTICLSNTGTPSYIFGYLYALTILLTHIYLLFTWIKHRHTFQVR